MPSQSRSFESLGTGCFGSQACVTIKGGEFPNMDAVEDNYLVLPLHTKISEDDALRVCKTIKEGC